MATLLNASTFFASNAVREPSIARYTTLMNTETMSHYGFYSATLHLSNYYHQVRDSLGPVESWRRYMETFPQDGRGYQNVIRNAQALASDSSDLVARTYDRWTTLNPQDTIAVMEYSRFCLDAGNASYSRGELRRAASFYERAVALDPYLERAYNNLGSVYAQQGDPAHAIEFFQKAIDLNPDYSDPYYNMGTAYGDTGNRVRALECTRKAARLGNLAAQEQLKRQGIVW